MVCRVRRGFSSLAYEAQGCLRELVAFAKLCERIDAVEATDLMSSETRISVAHV